MPAQRVPARIVGSVDADADGPSVVLSPKDFSYSTIEGAGAHVGDLIDGQWTINDIVAALEAPAGTAVGPIRTERLTFVSAPVTAELGPPPVGA